MRKKKKHLELKGSLTILGTAGAAFAIDRITKTIALKYGFAHVLNSGVAFGMMSGGNEPVILVLSILLIIALFIVAATASGRQPLLYTCGISVVLGGALGNVWDRLLLSSVPDWIPVFFMKPFYPQGFYMNIADIELFVGVCMVIASHVMEKRKR